MNTKKSMKRLRVAASPLTGRIYSGNVLKSGDTWAANQTDVTDEACAAVAHHVLLEAGPEATRGEITVSVNEKPIYRIKVEKLHGADHG